MKGILYRLCLIPKTILWVVGYFIIVFVALPVWLITGNDPDITIEWYFKKTGQEDLLK